MMFILSLWLLLSTLVAVSVQQCTLEGFNALDTVESTEASPDASAIISINSTFFNCLSTSEIIGIYNSMSVSVLYVQSNDPNNILEIRYNMQCINNVWKRVGMSRSALRSNETRRDCALCLNQTVNEDHCTPCDSSCTGLNQCYGLMANQCCSYNDGGVCTDDCGMNREGNSTFHCVCSNFWTGANCDMCGIPNCATCNDVGSACMQCQGGFQQNNVGVGCTEMTDDDGLESGVLIGIIAVICVVLLILIVLIIVIVVSCYRRMKRRNFV